jgi:hypothetical protein
MVQDGRVMEWAGAPVKGLWMVWRWMGEVGGGRKASRSILIVSGSRGLSEEALARLSCLFGSILLF